ncbi:MAG: hypothetical protein HYV14_16185 [Elusimicrobia bacterium]|nr:hypothetical protein [Elusimicrobiota bacterium]
MKLILALALLLPAFPAGAAAPETHPDLVRLEQDLTRKQDDKKESRITAEEYAEWETGFRSLLEASEAKVPPSSENTAARARIAALLGERDLAGASLERALETDPESPILLRTKGQLLYESEDYPGAAERGLRAWEKSGRTDRAAWALYQSAKGRGAPAGGASAAPSGGPAPTQGSAVAKADESSRPYKLPVKGGAKIAEVPSVTAVPAESNGNGLGLLTTLGVGAGVLLIAWGAVPQETKDHFKQVLWDQPKQEVKAAAAATAVIGAVYLGATYLPPLLGAAASAGPAAPALAPALAGGGSAGGEIVLQQAAVGTAKAGLLAGGAAIGLNKILGHVSYSKGDSGGVNSGGEVPISEENAGHIFRDAKGHVSDSLENRKMLSETAGDKSNFIGEDKFGNKWFSKLRSDGTQVWTKVRNGKIENGGVNTKPLTPQEILGNKGISP